ncbi:MAG: GNAT family N-acetyltransferase [Candidatus Krumholzibacteriia bacterium]
MLKIVEARSEDTRALVRELFVEYWNWLGFEPCFEGFDEELSDLDRSYGPPHGCMLLALSGPAAAGCVAVRRLSDECCEMKRLYVRPEFRGDRIGLQLVARIIDAGRGLGYACMRLDTLPQMEKAISLYECFHFNEIEPYKKDPIPGARYMELEL